MERLILTIFLTAMFIIALTSKNLPNKILTGLFVVAILLSWTKNNILITIGLGIFALGILSSGIYIGFRKEFKVLEKLCTISIACLILFQVWAMMMHLPSRNFFGLVMVLPAVGYIIALRKSDRNELREKSFCLVILAYGLMQSFKVIQGLIS